MIKQVTLRELRLDNGLTQEEMAKKIGVSKNIYGKYERGEINMPAYVFGNICNIFKISRDSLVIPNCKPCEYYKTTNQYFYDKGWHEAYGEMAKFAKNRATY